MRKLLKRLRNEEGFTLIEMTIVIMVIAILIIVLIPNLTNVNGNVSETTDKALRETVEAQMILFEVKEGSEPTLGTMVQEGYITSEQSDAYNELPKSGE